MQKEQLIAFSIRIAAPPARRWDVVRSLVSLIEPTRVSPGCRRVGLLVDFDDPNALVLIEEWETREEFDRQMVADKLKTLIAAADLSETSPVVRIDLIVREEGIEALGGIGVLAREQRR